MSQALEPAVQPAEPELPQPYERYRRLRSETPFAVNPATGHVLLTRYADVAAALRHPALGMSRVLEPAMHTPKVLQPIVRPAARVLSRMMLFTDPPDHTRLRGLANRAFTPRAVEGMRGRIEEIAESLLDALDRTGRRGPVDLVAGFADWLPVTVITEMLGAPVEKGRQIKAWSDDFALLITSSSQPAAVVAARGLRAVFLLQRTIKALVRKRRAHPGTTLLDGLIAAEESGDTLTEQELVSNALLLLGAGHITTTSLIGTGLLSLLRSPDQLDLLRRSSELLPSAVEELLRYESPLQFTGRVANEPLEIAGNPVDAGTTVALCLGAANHDPARFADPERLDLHRTDNRHLAFAGGAHFCLGAALARLEGQVAVGAVLRRFPDLRLAEERVEWRNAGVIRGLKRLRVFLR